MKRVHRFTCAVFLVFTALQSMPACSTHAPSAKNIPPTSDAAQSDPKKIAVAKVNDSVLTMDRLITMMNRLPDKTGGTSPETLEERKKRALDSLILLELAYQRAMITGPGVDPNKIEIGIENFKDNLGGDNEYREYLAKHGMTEEDLRSEIERSLAIEMIYTREVADKVTIPDEDLKKEYEKEKAQLIQQEKIIVTDVYLLKDEGKTSEKIAKELVKKIKTDAQKDPWKLVLDGTFMVRKLTVHKERNKELYDEAKKLKPRQLSGMIKTSTGIHIIKLENYTPERPLTFDEAKPALEAALKGPAQEKRTQEWEKELMKDAKIAFLTAFPDKEQQKP